MKKERADSDDSSGESFLQRWSREKARARVDGQAQAEEAVPADARPAPVAAGGEAGGSENPVELPSIDDLGPDSDYSAFMAPEVDSALRRLALRKLFRSPKFNVLDGLDDYNDDFTSFPPLGGIVTADMRHQLERAAKEAMARLEKATEPDNRPDAPAQAPRTEDSATPGVKDSETDADDEPA